MIFEFGDGHPAIPQRAVRGNPGMQDRDPRGNPAHIAYDVIVIDAFSLDSISLHLLIPKRLPLYQRELALDGVILFQISDRSRCPGGS
jgi:hypothetical protein